MMIMDTTDGNNLRILRRRKGLTQEEVADRLHISVSVYAQMENGKTRSWRVHLQRLCIIFQVSPKELFVKDGETIRSKQREIDGLYDLSLFLAHRLIDKYETWLKEKDDIITLLKNRE